MKYLSLFSGIGGFELGIKQAYEHIQKLRFKDKRQTIQRTQVGSTKGQSKQLFKLCMEGLSCVGYSEIDKYAIQIYQKHFPEHKNYGDITKLDPSALPDFDFLCGGFPCQAFSIAGKRRGFDDTRGTLFFDIARILKAKTPKLFLLENVKGLLSHDNGNTFKTIISTLDELGYDLQWQVLNSKNFGVPQNRERVFIVGHLRGTRRPEVFPISEGNKNRINQLNQPTHSNDRIYGTQGIGPTLNTAQGGRRQPKIAPTLRANHHNTADVHFVQVSKTVRSGGRGSPHGSKQNWDSYDVGGKIRRLTPKECERLQGFPDGWTEAVSDTQRYKCLGNAVTVNVIQEIIRRML